MDLEFERMITANIALDIFCIALCMIPVICLFGKQWRGQKLNQYFIAICLSNALMIVGDLGDWTLRDINGAGLWFLLAALTVLYYICSALILFFFTLYINETLQLPKRQKTFFITAVTALCGVQVVFTVLSPFAGLFFYLDQNGYHRGSLFPISQVIPLVCYAIFIYFVLRYRRKLSRREFIFSLSYILMPLAMEGVQILFRGVAVLNCGITFAMLLIFVNIQLERELAFRNQEKDLAEQRIDLMLSQIQPHFLYNSLGTIAELCKHDPETAEKATLEFTNFLRGNMDSLSTREPIPFGKELEHVKNYLYLEQQRFGSRLCVVYNIETDDFYIPALSLQPLVENAVRHGILKKREGGRLTISTRETDEYAVVTIEDDGIGIEKSKTLLNLGDHAHIGVKNVRSRIETMMNGSMTIESSDSGTVVTMRIPW